MMTRDRGPLARARIVMAEKGLTGNVEFVSIAPISAEQKQPSFRAENPIRKDPSIELDDGTIVSEVYVITGYLDPWTAT